MNDLTQLVQGTPEWRAARCGSLGASDIWKIAAKTKTGWATSRDDIKAELGCEILTGEHDENSYQNSAMLDGIAREPIARNEYAFQRNVDVVQVGIVKHPRINGTHASPDGLVGENGLVEIKCPKKSTHWKSLGGGKAEKKYRLQCIWQMACTGREWVDLVSFHPGFPEEMKLHLVERIERNEKEISETEELVKEFLAELNEELEKRRQLYMMAEAA